MTELQRLNETPLSKAVKELLPEPWSMSLYLTQALQLAMEEYTPAYPRHLAPRAWQVRSEMEDLLASAELRFGPETWYLLMTTSEDEEMNDSYLLSRINEETDPEEKLWILLDEVESNLQNNGFLST